MSKKHVGPKILLLDIETSPLQSFTWGLWQQNVALNQIKADWHLLSWSAKWLHDPPSKIMYQDQRNAKNIEDDSKLLASIWKLLDEADIVLGQNSNKFDIKKLNARFIINGLQPPSSYKKIDTLQIAKKQFGFTSNKLEYMADKLNTKYKKLKHANFSGFELWKQCLAGNIKAWKEMEKYNKHDVLALEELYTKLRPWDTSGPNHGLYTENDEHICSCGSKEFKKNGFAYTANGKFTRFKCKKCGSETRDKFNLLDKEKAKNLKVNVK